MTEYIRLIIKFIIKSIDIFLAICIVLSFWSPQIFGQKGNYYEKADYEYPFAGINNIRLDEEYIYCFSQYFQAVNVYDKEGEFSYSIKVPNMKNGRGCMYFWKGYLCVKNNYGDIYQYKNGDYIYRIIYDSDVSDECTRYNVFDSTGNLVATEETADAIIGSADGKLDVTSDFQDEIFESNFSEEDKNGDVYSIDVFRPKLRKNNQTIMLPQMVKILCSSPMLSMIYLLLFSVLEQVGKYIFLIAENTKLNVGS